MSSHGHWLRQIIFDRIRIIRNNVGRVVHWWGFACSMSTNHLSEILNRRRYDPVKSNLDSLILGKWHVELRREAWLPRIPIERLELSNM
jgi:hypothetical protein